MVDGKKDEYHDSARIKTQTRMKQLMISLNPLQFSDDRGKRFIPKENQFVMYLSPENRAKSKKIHSEYQYRIRQMRKHIKKYEKIHGDLFKAGRKVDILPIPPKFKILAREFKSLIGFGGFLTKKLEYLKAWNLPTAWSPERYQKEYQRGLPRLED